jgi:hypothetical protein
MRRSTFLSLAAKTCLVLPAAAQKNPKAGFKPMFNGRDLKGWVNVNCAPSTWTVRDGMVVSTGIPTGVLRTTRMYENFILEMEWKHIKPNGNAGLFVHSGPLPIRGEPFTKAIEVQVIDGNHPEGLWTGHGDVFPIQGATFVPDRPHPQGWSRCLPSERRARPAGQWNHYRVECRDGRISLAVNGKVVSGGTQCSPRRGYICLESEGSECHFRGMRIQELPSSRPPEEEIAEKDEGFVSLYTGVDLRGWRDEAAPGWKPNDWTLAADGTGPDLWTAREFGDFRLIADVRLTGKAAGREDAALLLRGADGISLPLTPVGEWSRFELTLRGDRLTLARNGKTFITNARQTGLPARGRIGLRAGGNTFQFANLYVRPM